MRWVSIKQGLNEYNEDMDGSWFLMDQKFACGILLLKKVLV